MDAHLVAYLEIANLCNKSKGQLTEMAHRYRLEDSSIKYEHVHVAAFDQEEIDENRRGRIRGNGGEGSVFEWMNTYEGISNALCAHLFRFNKTMYLLFPYEGPVGDGKVDLYSIGARVKAPGAAEAGASEAVGGAAEARTLELNPNFKTTVARATHIAMRTLCRQLLYGTKNADGTLRKGYPNMTRIVPCGFSLGAFFATQFTYYWLLSKQKAQCSAIAMAPVPIAPIYTEVKAAQNEKVFAFALVVERDKKRIIDNLMLSDYFSERCTPPANLRYLTYVPPDTVQFSGDVFLDLGLSIEKNNETATLRLEHTKKTLKLTKKRVDDLKEKLPEHNKLYELYGQALGIGIRLPEPLLTVEDFNRLLKDMRPVADIKLLTYALATNQLYNIGISNVSEDILAVQRNLIKQADSLNEQTRPLATLRESDEDKTPSDEVMLKHYYTRVLAEAYINLAAYTLRLKWLKNPPGIYVAARNRHGFGAFHLLSTYIDMAKKAFVPADSKLSLKFHIGLQLKF